MTFMTQSRFDRVMSYPIDPTHIGADATLVVCIDPRWWNALGTNPLSLIQAFINAKRWTCVPLTEAGGVKLLASEDPADAIRKEVLLQRIEQELGLHHPGILALSVHRDCGAYGYAKAFGNDPDHENDRLVADLMSARKICDERFGSRARIELYIYDAEGVEEVNV